jgi:Transcriptional regulator
MDLHYLEIFHILAKNLSFSRTANELHISQPAISIQIKNLEEELGFKLVERYGKTIFLTKEGQVVYEYTKKIFELMNDMDSSLNILRGKMSGRIRVGASNTPGIYIIPQILGIFHQKHPDVILNLHIGNTQEIQDRLIRDELDFAIIGGEINMHKIVTVEKVVEDVMVLIASPLNVLSTCQYVDLNMLSGQQYVTHDESSQLYKDMKGIIQKFKLPFNVSMTLGSIDAIKRAVAANLGISIVPYTAAFKDIEEGSLKRIDISDIEWKYPYNLVYQSKKKFSVPIIILLEMIRNQITHIVPK